MRKTFASLVLLAGLVLALGLYGCNNRDDQRPALETVNDRVSYSIGLNIGEDFVAQELDIDPDLLALGIKHALAGHEPLLSEQQMHEAITAFQEDMLGRQEAKFSAQQEENLRLGRQFLAENADREDVMVTDSGLQYRVFVEGEGASPGVDDVVSVHYEGRLVDGTVFDSSLERGEPAVFPVAGVIPGWTEALQLMQEGDKWEIALPADLAYGEQGVPPVIGPNAVLVFEVELLEVNP
ncbi:FKBP-type peptidyl-prolyl cis-trans isomerase [Desulfurivibrio alkaliphilus]|uniref:Peptidyl-prolyl cis-trans isomerase n=1 Tax=Desulfurivibrio alkaliphilus (strain DSM 19089 / UNIQEM U267 / AHT2) TaxID=589865 RepID=D6Z174_DESAT|nr:FKBP-type peptidyl-prolyl cis-trans isomerase [Desulfurivibrio alkaliphilus]ADH85329.1 FKBP-type peptidyl-prolyl isomerase domain protein [Desulfurivibrio alkaliphilus AHT 2]